MQTRESDSHRWVRCVGIGLLLLATLACNSLPRIRVDWPGAKETADPQAAGVGSPTPSTVAQQQGESRVQPFPVGTVAATDYWEIQVLEVLRGQQAWQQIHAANRYNLPPPEGQEYLLLRMRVRCGDLGAEAMCELGMGVQATGDRLVVYSAPAVVAPTPQLPSRLQSGETAEGWEIFQIAEGEQSLMLVLDEPSSEPTPPYYLAIDPGASIIADLALLEITPTQAGTSITSPVPLGERAVTEDWEVSVLDVVWGEDAWKWLVETNQFNDPPAAGREYGLALIQIRYIDIMEGPAYVSRWYINVWDSSLEEARDLPSLVVPEPDFSAKLFPGGEFMGWVAFDMPEGENSPLLVFTPYSGDYETRYFALRP